MNATDPLDLTFAALADGTRRAVLERLMVRDAGVGELAAAFPLTQPAMTRHLQVLERAGLISRSRDGQRRPARLRVEGLVPADDWLRRARTEWSDRFDRLEAHLAAPISSPRPAENGDD